MKKLQTLMILMMIGITISIEQFSVASSQQDKLTSQFTEAMNTTGEKITKIANQAGTEIEKIANQAGAKINQIANQVASSKTTKDVKKSINAAGEQMKKSLGLKPEKTSKKVTAPTPLAVQETASAQLTAPEQDTLPEESIVLSTTSAEPTLLSNNTEEHISTLDTSLAEPLQATTPTEIVHEEKHEASYNHVLPQENVVSPEESIVLSAINVEPALLSNNTQEHMSALDTSLDQPLQAMTPSEIVHDEINHEETPHDVIAEIIEENVATEPTTLIVDTTQILPVESMEFSQFGDTDNEQMALSQLTKHLLQQEEKTTSADDDNDDDDYEFVEIQE